MNALKTLPGLNWVCGVTCLDDKLFVLYQRKKNQLEVYSTRTSEDFKRLDLFTVQGFAGRDWHNHNDMTSSPQDKCLYISEHSYGAVHKSALDGQLIMSFAVPKSPRGISMTSNNTLLVMCYHPSPETVREPSRKLVELCGRSGTYIRQVELQSDTEHPYHAVELYGDGPTQQCVIAHSCCDNARSKVAVVDRDEGNVLQRYAETDTPLFFIRYLAVDKHNFVFAADQHGGVVTVISPSLQFVRSVKLANASRLYLDNATRRLYVGHLHGVTVLQL